MDASTAVTVANTIGVKNTIKIAAAIAKSQNEDADDVDSAGKDDGVIASAASSISTKAKGAATSVINFVKGTKPTADVDEEEEDVGVPPPPLPLPWSTPLPSLAPIEYAYPISAGSTSKSASTTVSSSSLSRAAWASALTLAKDSSNGDIKSHPYVASPPPVKELMEAYSVRRALQRRSRMIGGFVGLP